MGKNQQIQIRKSRGGNRAKIATGVNRVGWGGGLLDEAEREMEDKGGVGCRGAGRGGGQGGASREKEVKVWKVRKRVRGRPQPLR